MTLEFYMPFLIGVLFLIAGAISGIYSKALYVLWMLVSVAWFLNGIILHLMKLWE